MGDLVPRSDDDGDSTESGDGKLGRFSSLPAEFKDPLRFFWSLYKHLLPVQIPLVLRVQVWRKKHGLTAGELRAVLDRVTDPDHAATHRFAADLLCDLEATVGELVRQRKKAAQVSERRREDERAEADAIPADELAALLKLTAERAKEICALSPAERRKALITPTAG